MVLSLAATTVSNARTPGSFTDTLIKWIFIFIGIIILAVLAFVVYLVFFSDARDFVSDIPSFSPLILVPGVGGILSLISRF